MHFALCLLFLSACTSAFSSTRPVVKIGLLAPFEGLHRQSGYEALTALRAAIAENPVPGVDVLPLALDTSADPAQARRAARKLLLDPGVGALIGPLRPPQIAASAESIQAAELLWLLPTAPASPAAAEFVVALAQATGAESLALAGLGAGWPEQSAQQWSETIGRPVLLTDDPQAAATAGAVLWLGEAEDGAAFVAELRELAPALPVWATSIGGDAVFARLLLARLRQDDLPLGPVYWGLLLPGDTQSDAQASFAQWAQTRAPATPTAYAVYRAAQSALRQLADPSARVPAPALAIFQLQPDGSSQPFAAVPFP